MRKHLWLMSLSAAVLLGVFWTVPVLADSGFPRVTANTNVSSADKRPAREHSTPFVLADPADPLRVFVAEEELRSRTCRLHVSHDGGATFLTAKGNPLPPAFDFCTANAGYIALPMAWAKDGALLIAMYALRQQDNSAFAGRASIVLSRTYDEGQSWQSVLVRDNRNSDPKESAWQVHLASDVVNNRVYVGWMALGIKAPEATNPLRKAYVAASTDGGKTFGSPIDMTAAPAGVSLAGGALTNQAGPSIALGPDGTLYALYMENTVTKAVIKPLDMVVARTKDLGKTVETFRVQTRTGFTGFPELTAAAYNGGTALVAVFEDLSLDPVAAKQGVREIFMSRSSDRGATWTDRKRINDDPASGYFSKYFPKVSAAPNGRIDAAWYDFRNDNGKLMSDVYYSNSKDGGATWTPNLRMSDKQSDRHFGNFAHYSDVRGPVGLGSNNFGAFVAWDDSRNADAITENQDIYFGAAQLSALPAPSNSTVVAYAAAAGVGLAIAAVILYLASVRLRRRSSKLVESPA
ncbi:MAG: hypothetical protein NVS1B3_02990 [Candidatus Dormibacteraceae bacterium]